MKNYLVLILALFTGAQSLLAVDKYWRPLNSDFHVATNWDPIGVPNASDRVILDQFGQADMIISEDVSVGGWLQYNNYFEEVYITDGHSLTVGSQDFFMDSGGFYAGGGSMDINGNFEVHGGGFDSPLTALYVQGDFEINPYPLGGWFVDQTAHYELDGFQHCNLIASIALSNLTINKQGGFQLVIPAGLFIQVNGYAEWLNGPVNGDGILRFSGDTYVGPSSTGGNCLVEFRTTGEQILEIDKNAWNVDLMEVNMQSASDTLRVISTIADFDMQTSGDTLRVRNGKCLIDYFNTWNLQQAVTVIEPTGTLIAPPTDLKVHGNWTNNGGSFLHNAGTVIMEAFRHGTFDVNGTETFFNLQMAKDGGFAATVADGDILRVENRMDFVSGYLNGSNGILQVEDTLVFGASHLIGNCPVEVMSDKVSNIIVNETGSLLNVFDIEKTNATDTVYFETENGHIQAAAPPNRLDIRNGVVAFKDYGSHVDWNFANTEIHNGGTLLAPDGHMIFSGNLTESGGNFLHNMGLWSFDAPTTSTLDVSNRIDFYNVEMDKSSSFTLTIAAGDSLVALNKYISSRGFLNNAAAWLIAEDSLVSTGGHQRGSIPVVLGGSGDGHWIVDEVSVIATDISVNKANATDRVWVETNLSSLKVGEADEILTLESGILGFQNVGELVELDFGSIVIEPDATFEAFNGKTSLAGNLYEQGGSFDHNMGLWEFYLARTATLDVSDRIEFYNVEMDKPSSFSVNVASGDSLIALNRFESTRGFLNNADARVLCEDSVIHTPGHQRGSIPLTFGGNGDGHWIVNEVSVISHNTQLNKDNPADRVWVETGLSFLQMGEADEDLTLDRGTLAFSNTGGLVEMDYGDVFINPEATFEAYNGRTSFSGNLYEQGGSFDHNMGLWEFYKSTTATLDVTDRIAFHNVEMDKPSSFSLNVASGDSLVAENKYTSLRGFVNNPASWIIVEDSLETTPGHQRGSIKLVFGGTGDGHWTNNEVSSLIYDISVNKSSMADKVWVRSDDDVLEIGEADEVLSIIKGELGFESVVDHVDFNYGNLSIQPEGIFEAWSGNTLASGSISETGGQFKHNMGTWQFNASITASLDVSERIEFWNAELNKSSGFSLNLASGDSLIAVNRISFLQGYLNNTDSRAVALDSAVVGTSHLRGTTPLVFMGDADGTWLHNETTTSFYQVHIRKDGAAVDMHSSAADLAYGSSNESLTVYSGTLEVNQGPGIVNWSVGNTSVMGGTLALHAGLTNWTYHFTFDSGDLLHRDGSVRIGSSTASTFDLSDDVLFGTVEFNKSSGFTTTISGSGRLLAEHQVNFMQGYCSGATVVSLGNADVSSSFLGGTTALAFEGSTDQTFDLTGAESKYEGVIRMDKPSGNVVLTSNLDVEDNFAQLDFVSGNITYQDPLLQTVRFLTGVSTGWTGGNDDSYIDGAAVKFGQANTYLPVGNDGTFAPCGVEAMWPPSDAVRASYNHNSPLFGALDPALDHISSCEFWEIQGEAGAPAARLILSYDSNRCGPIDNPSTLAVAMWNGSGWDNLGQAGDTGFYLTSASVPATWTAFTLASTNGDNPMNSSGSPCPYDIDGSGHHDTADLLLLLGQFGCTSGCTSDLTGDDAVDTADLLALLGVFGTPCP